MPLDRGAIWVGMHVISRACKISPYEFGQSVCLAYVSPLQLQLVARGSTDNET